MHLLVPLAQFLVVELVVRRGIQNYLAPFVWQLALVNINESRCCCQRGGFMYSVELSGFSAKDANLDHWMLNLPEPCHIELHIPQFVSTASQLLLSLFEAARFGLEEVDSSKRDFHGLLQLFCSSVRRLKFL